MKKHQIRIVGGKYKRSLIPVIEGEHLRPTPDRVRETLFNWLGHFWDNNFADKKVLDLFAGTGALGLEAASRGVAQVQIIDNSSKAIGQIKKTLQKLADDTITVSKIDAIRYLAQQNQEKFDLVFLDPPFGENLLEIILPTIGNVLHKHGLIYIEAEASLNLVIPDNFEVLRQNKAGNVQYCLLKFAALQKCDNN